GKFAIEAKAFTNGHGDMVKHKKQSQSGGIKVNFTVACISYNLHNKVKCKYHDPFNDNVPFDHEGLRELTKDYYSGFVEFMNEKHFRVSQIKINNEDFYEIELLPKSYKKIYPEEFPFNNFWFYDFFDHYRLRLILPKNVAELAKEGLTNQTEPFAFKPDESGQKNLYIDNDRVGLRIW
ncbi:MAG: hypothetical protein ACK40M_10425, partial [Flavobacteriales bacterium]